MFKRYHIWKLQRPIIANGEHGMNTVMAYTEDKAQMAMIPLGLEIMDELFGDELKIYVRATVKNGILKVDEIVEEQDW